MISPVEQVDSSQDILEAPPQNNQNRTGRFAALIAAGLLTLTGEVQAVVTPEEMAARGREAIAQRYKTCEIVKVKDHHEEKPRMKLGSLPRNRVDITVKTTKSDIAQYYEAMYEEDNTVIWQNPKPIGRLPVPGKKGEEALGIPVATSHQPFGLEDISPVSFSLHPQVIYSPGDQIAVFVGQDVETTDFKNRQRFSNLNVTHCGTLVLTEAVEGNTWQIDHNAIPIENIYRVEECDLVTQDGTSFNSQC